MDDDHLIFKVPFGFIRLQATGEKISRVQIYKEIFSGENTPLSQGQAGSETLRRAKEEILEYLSGKRKFFSLTLDLSQLTEFQRKVLEAVMKIPYGETRSYSEIAKMIGTPLKRRAVGQALKNNPLPILIPCHRVIRSNGKIGGFSSGKDIKILLLKLEKAKE